MTHLFLLQLKIALIHVQHPMVDITLLQIMEMKWKSKSPSTKLSILIRLYNSNATLDLFCQTCTRVTDNVKRMRRGQDWSRHVLVIIWATPEGNGSLWCMPSACAIKDLSLIQPNIMIYEKVTYKIILLADAKCYCYAAQTRFFFMEWQILFL